MGEQPQSQQEQEQVSRWVGGTQRKVVAERVRMLVRRTTVLVKRRASKDQQGLGLLEVVGSLRAAVCSALVAGSQQAVEQYLAVHSQVGPRREGSLAACLAEGVQVLLLVEQR